MKRVVALYEEVNKGILKENLSILKELWQDMGYEFVELAISEEGSPDEYMNEIVRLKEEYLMTFAMAGFAWCGLMGQVRFNTLEAMQIHILVGSLPQYDYYLQKEYGIQNFFVTDNTKLFEGWKEKYPQVPYMNSIPTIYMAEHLSDEEKLLNRQSFRVMLQKVMDFIENPSVL